VPEAFITGDMEGGTSFYHQHKLHCHRCINMLACRMHFERAFSAMSFIKNRLGARLTKSLQLCMRAKLQQHFNVDTFPYGSVL
jgi:hypothetical protein